ncbi:MAG: peroxiredoxin [Ignavibacteria bacterium]|jgi:peroxiredoxin Q/BCP|nr:peroxiredoxin [Ignavibacteria bacterium]MCU7502094.1 peroxiredoxin [Ignavibacteria bacterium]MCU7515496.1 peroxiredoxin [Ignavibacteria bacterium]
MTKLLVLSVLSGLLFSVLGGDAKTLKEGEKAPDFVLEDAYGHSYKLSSFRDKSPVVLYFYPKAGTSGCTKEACGIRDDLSKFKKNNITVLGVSVDSKAAIKKFIDEYHLNFPLLSDEGKNVSKDYGVLNKLGVDNRITFIIDKKGTINSIIRNVDVTTHSAQVYSIASKLL